MAKPTKRKAIRFPNSARQQYLFFIDGSRGSRIVNTPGELIIQNVCVLTMHACANVQVVLKNNHLFEHDLFVTRSSNEQINGLFIKIKPYMQVCICMCQNESWNFSHSAKRAQCVSKHIYRRKYRKNTNCTVITMQTTKLKWKNFMFT